MADKVETEILTEMTYTDRENNLLQYIYEIKKKHSKTIRQLEESSRVKNEKIKNLKKTNNDLFERNLRRKFALSEKHKKEDTDDR